MTLNVALTGNVAAGKTAVLERFAGLGATVINADALVRELQRPGTDVHRAIVARFGTGMLDPEGRLDRAALRERVMADRSERIALEGIVHPEVAGLRRKLLAEATARGDRVVISEIPLLFEADDPDEYDMIILVDAPVSTRIERMMEHRGMSAAAARAVIESQLPAEAKRGRAHYLIDNDGTEAELHAKVDEVWRALTE